MSITHLALYYMYGADTERGFIRAVHSQELRDGPILATLLCTPAAGISRPLPGRRVQGGVQRGGYASAADVVSDEMAETFLVCGAPDDGGEEDRAGVGGGRLLG